MRMEPGDRPPPLKLTGGYCQAQKPFIQVTLIKLTETATSSFLDGLADPGRRGRCADGDGIT
jgi:hypothetical protein